MFNSSGNHFLDGVFRPVPCHSIPDKIVDQEGPTLGSGTQVHQGKLAWSLSTGRGTDSGCSGRGSRLKASALA